MKNDIDSNFAIAILALVAACVGFAFWLNMANHGFAEVEHQNVVVTDSVSSVVSEDEAMGYTAREVEVIGDSSQWIKYSNEEIGISFKYPPLLGEVNLSDEFTELCENDSSKECGSHITLGFEKFGIFLATKNKLAHKNSVGRDGYFGDSAGAIVNEEYVRGICDNGAFDRIDCVIFTTKNGNLVAKQVLVGRDYQLPMDIYSIHSSHPTYYGIVVSNRGFLDEKYSQINSGKLIKELVESIEFLQK